MNMLNLPKKVYFKNGSMDVALRELGEVYHLKRAFLVASPNLFKSGAVSFVDTCLRKQGIRTAEYFCIDAVPSFDNIRNALPKLLEFEPDVIVGVGGGSAMSAAKAMWMLYENPDLDFAQAAEKPDSIHTGDKAKLVLVATSFGSGAQNSPFAVLKNEKGEPCVIASFQLLPEISVTDARFAESLSPAQITACALSTLSQSVRAFADASCNEYTQGLLREAIRLILQNLPQVKESSSAALEKLHNAAAIAGAAYGNVLRTLEPAAPAYPTKAEKGKKDARIDQLARELGFACTKDFQEVCVSLR